MRSPSELPQQVGQDRSTRLRDVGRLRRERLAARKGQQLLGQRARPCRPPLPRRVRRASIAGSAFTALFIEVEVRLDDLKDVVEVVRHAAGELAGRLHLLALPQRHLVAQLLGDVDAANDRTATRHLAARDLVVATVIRARAPSASRPERLDAELQRLEQRAHRRQALGEQLIARQRRRAWRDPSPRERTNGSFQATTLPLGVDHEDRVLKAFKRRLQQPRRDRPVRAARPPGGRRRGRRCTCRRRGTGRRRS